MGAYAISLALSTPHILARSLVVEFVRHLAGLGASQYRISLLSVAGLEGFYSMLGFRVVRRSTFVETSLSLLPRYG